MGTDEEFAYRLTQGRFPAGVEARLTGPGGERLPWDGESAGELEVRGPWIAGAYYNGTDAEPLRPADKFSEDGWLKTGDVGTISPTASSPSRTGPRTSSSPVVNGSPPSSWRTP